MGKNFLMDEIKKIDKKGLFTADTVPTFGFPTGLTLYDALNGFLVTVPNKDFTEIVDSWYNMGVMGGQFVMEIGNSGTGKTALAIQAGSNMVAPYEYGMFLHADAEHTSEKRHIMKLNHWRPDMMEDRYRMLDIAWIEDMQEVLVNLARVKLENRKALTVDTGFKDSFGKPIKILAPTAVLMDSLPMFQCKELLNEKTGMINADAGISNAHDMRTAAAYSKFFRLLRPLIYQANITVFITNHIKTKPQMGFIPTQSKLQGLAPEESLPGGTAPIYLSSSLNRLIYKGKCQIKDHGFEGFKVACLSLKSKTNRSDLRVELVYRHNYGFDNNLSLLNFANEMGIVQGRNPYRYFKSNPNVKFNSKDFIAEISRQPEIVDLLKKETDPYVKMICSGGEQINPLKDEMSIESLSSVIDKSFMEKDMDENAVAAAI